jgi:nucleoside-diphosphate-sugar epimerase
MRVLVTGANGFVGSHLVRHLLAEGQEVHALVRHTSDLRLLEGLSPQYAYGDVTDEASLAESMKAGFDVVYHVAGVIAALDQAGFDRVNRDGARKVAAAALAAARPPSRMLLVSSIAAGGPSTADRPRTEAEPAAPVSLYGHSKLGGEQVWKEALEGRIPWTIVRPPIVYGPGDTATLDLFVAARRGVSPRILGPPAPLSYIHVDDLIRLLQAAAEHPGGVGGTFYGCSPGHGPMVEFQHAIGRAVGRSVVNVPIPRTLAWLAGEGASLVQAWQKRPRPFGRDKIVEALQRGWWMDDTAARTCLGWEGRIGWDEGLAGTVAWYREKGWL